MDHLRNYFDYQSCKDYNIIYMLRISISSNDINKNKMQDNVHNIYNIFISVISIQ